MSIALVGLVIFQLYWIDSVMRENEERFKKDVISALHTVSEKLEKQETYSIINQQLHAYRPQIIRSPLHAQGGQASFFFEIHDSLGLAQDFSFYFDLSGGNYQFSQEPFPNKTSPDQSQAPWQDLEGDLQKVSNKSNMMVSVLRQMVSNERFANRRIRPTELDSMLTGELQERGINIAFNYGVLTPRQDQFIFLKSPSSGEELVKSELKASLFPNDLTGPQEMLVVDFPAKSQFLLGKIWFTSASSGVLVLVIMFCFGYAVRTILRQKKLSEMKSDFINNMTHELKTPIATVGLAVEALQDEALKKEAIIRDKYLSMIGEENHRLGQHVEKVLQMAAIEKRDVTMKMEPIDLHELISKAQTKIGLQVESKNGTLKAILNAREFMVRGDQVHLMNVVLNLLDNALKYSPENPHIVIRTEQSRENLVLSIQDHGQGMSKEALKQIFQKFYRVPTGNVHNVKGFGLGLSYVKNVIDQHGGKVQVESELGKGSKFFIILPTFHAES